MSKAILNLPARLAGSATRVASVFAIVSAFVFGGATMHQLSAGENRCLDYVCNIEEDKCNTVDCDSCSELNNRCVTHST